MKTQTDNFIAYNDAMFNQIDLSLQEIDGEKWQMVHVKNALDDEDLIQSHEHLYGETPGTIWEDIITGHCENARNK